MKAKKKIPTVKLQTPSTSNGAKGGDGKVRDRKPPHVPETPFQLAYYMLKEIGVCTTCHRRWIEAPSTIRCTRCYEWQREFMKEHGKKYRKTYLAKKRRLKNA